MGVGWSLRGRCLVGDLEQACPGGANSSSNSRARATSRVELGRGVWRPLRSPRSRRGGGRISSSCRSSRRHWGRGRRWWR
uniref:Uncharacterized protein n=1 Tax=Arundo donax TaxID=35708 RepID=A0A0A9BV19_ARUDO